MKKLLLILLCLPMIFSCGENHKEDKEKEGSFNEKALLLKEKEERTVYCFFWDSDYYNYQRIDGYKEFKFGDNISNFSDNLIPYYAPFKLDGFPDAFNHYHLSPLFLPRSSYNWEKHIVEGHYKCSFEVDSFQDLVKSIARASLRGMKGISLDNIHSYKRFYYRDNISRTFLGHYVKDVILGFKDSNLEEIVIILPPPYVSPIVNAPSLSRWKIAQSLQDRFGVENKWSFECMDHIANGYDSKGMYFYTQTHGYKPKAIGVSNELVDRGISISLDSYKLNNYFII